MKHCVRPYKSFRPYQGHSLFEVMLALVLSIVILHAVIQFYLSFKRYLQTQLAITRVQQSIRVTSLILEQYVRSDGDLGCLNLRRLPSWVQLSFEHDPEVDLPEDQVLNIRRIGKNTLISDCRIAALQHIGFESYAFYVQKTTRKNERGQPIYALYSKLLGKPAVELVEGIRDLEVTELREDARLGVQLTLTAEDIELPEIKRTWTQTLWYF